MGARKEARSGRLFLACTFLNNKERKSGRGGYLKCGKRNNLIQGTRRYYVIMPYRSHLILLSSVINRGVKQINRRVYSFNRYLVGTVT